MGCKPSFLTNSTAIGKKNNPFESSGAALSQFDRYPTPDKPTPC
jgi:hypothetical protein